MFLKILVLQGKVPNFTFQWSYLQRKTSWYRSLLSVSNFPNMINLTQIVRHSQIPSFNKREKVSQDVKRKVKIFC